MFSCQFNEQVQWRIAVGGIPTTRSSVDALLLEPPRLRAALICAREGKPYALDGFRALWHRTMSAFVPPAGSAGTCTIFRAQSARDADCDQGTADRLGHRSAALTRRVYRRLPGLADPCRCRPHAPNSGYSGRILGGPANGAA